MDPIKPAVTAHLREMSAFKLYRVVKKEDWHGRAQPMVSILERCPRERELIVLNFKKCVFFFGNRPLQVSIFFE